MRTGGYLLLTIVLLIVPLIIAIVYGRKEHFAYIGVKSDDDTTYLTTGKPGDLVNALAELGIGISSNGHLTVDNLTVGGRIEGGTSVGGNIYVVDSGQTPTGIVENKTQNTPNDAKGYVVQVGSGKLIADGIQTNTVYTHSMDLSPCTGEECSEIEVKAPLGSITAKDLTTPIIKPPTGSDKTVLIDNGNLKIDSDYMLISNYVQASHIGRERAKNIECKDCHGQDWSINIDPYNGAVALGPYCYADQQSIIGFDTDTGLCQHEQEVHS